MKKTTCYWTEYAKHCIKAVKKGRLVSARKGDDVLVTDGYTACVVPYMGYDDMRRVCPYLEPLEDGQTCYASKDDVHVEDTGSAGLWKAATLPEDAIPATRTPIMQDIDDKRSVRWYRISGGGLRAIDTRYDALLQTYSGDFCTGAGDYAAIYAMHGDGYGIMALPIRVKPESMPGRFIA